jgi:hypothetical protein
MNPADIYYDQLRAHAGRANEQQFESEQALSEAAHEAYRQTADQLTRAGWDEERALVVTRGMNEVVRGWLGRPDREWTDLREQLRGLAARWDAAAPGS